MYILHHYINYKKKVIRIISHSAYIAPTFHLFKDLKVLTLPKLYIYRIHIFMYKYSINSLPKELMFMFKKNKEIHQHNTRNNDKFFTSSVKLCQTNRIVRQTGVKIWNMLEHKLNFKCSFFTYKHQLKKYLLDNNLMIISSKCNIDYQ